MSLFDTVIIKCPSCGKQIHFQSKSGDCNLKEYSYKSVPIAVAIGVIGDTEMCENCGQEIKLQTNIKNISLYSEDYYA